MTSSELPELPPATRRRAGSPREEEVERLLRLMGGMLADAYVVLETSGSGPRMITDPREVEARNEASSMLDGLTTGLARGVGIEAPEHQRNKSSQHDKGEVKASSAEQFLQF